MQKRVREAFYLENKIKPKIIEIQILNFTL